MAKNTLYYGDNLDVLRRYVKDESVDLVYLDPPFNSNANYNVLFAEKSGTKSTAQIEAFEDTWQWDEAAAAAYREVVESGGSAAQAMVALRTFLGDSDMLAYLAMMAPRLVELRRSLKPTGSIYLHCDPTASHYLKMLMDAVFGAFQFRNEIVWRRVTAHSDSKKWSPVADVIFYYGKSERPTWNAPLVPHDPEYLKDKYRHEDERGVYRLDNMTSPNPRPNMMYEWKGHASPAKGWRYSRETMAKLDADGRIWYPDSKSKRPQLKRYISESGGMLMGTVWTDIPPINSRAQERLGYPTQKPEALLERIINASSNEGDVVLDPFCGCGTTVAAAQKLGRQWIGIDVTHLAIALIKKRLADTYGDEAAYDVIGEPVTVEGAKELAASDPYQFQWWALSLVHARPAEQKKGKDRGIDGRIYFHDGSGETQSIILSVKAGHTGPDHVRDLRGTVEREKAAIGVLITMQEPTKEMRKEAATGEFYLSDWGKHAKIQLLTVGDLLEGKNINRPPDRQTGKTFKKAPKAKAKKPQAGRLGFDGG